MPKTIDVYTYVHTHWDREWYRTFQEYRLRLVEVIDLILKKLDNKELDYFTLDGQTIILEDYLEVRPENHERITNYIKEEKLFIGPWYVLPDEFLVSGESLIQNLFIGNKLSKIYGKKSAVGYLVDTFGHSIDIPKILQGANINNSVIWRGINTNKTECNWYSKDKSKITAIHLLEGYYIDIFHNKKTSSKEKADLLKKLLDNIHEHTTQDFIILPIGGDHLPPPDNIKEQFKKIKPYLTNYNFIESNLKEITEKINTPVIKENIEDELRDCTKSFILPGTYSSRMYLKQSNTKLTNCINNIIEPFTAYCNLLNIDNFKLPNTEYLWKLLIKNHAHDSICGCSIDGVHKEIEQRFDELDQACTELLNRGKLALIKNTPENKVVVFNNSNFEYTGPVKLKTYHKTDIDNDSQLLNTSTDRFFTFYSDINENLPATIIKDIKEQLIWANKIPAKSLKIVEPKPLSNIIQETSKGIKNNLIEISVNEDSIDIIDLETQETYKNINQIIDCPDAGDSYNFGPINSIYWFKGKIKSYFIQETGPIRGCIQLTYEIKIPERLNDNRSTPSEKLISHEIICNIYIYRESKIIEFNLSWNNESKDHLLQVVFPTNKNIEQTISENHFGIIERMHDSDYEIRDNLPSEKYKEAKYNTVPMQRFVQANNIAIFSEGLPEYEINKNLLKLTVLRATSHLSRADVPTRTAEAGPNLDVSDNQCIRKCYARYAIYPATSVNKLYKTAERFSGCIVSVVGEKQNIETSISQNNLISLNNPNIILTCCKQDSDYKNLIVHLLNISNNTESVEIASSFSISKITPINLLGESISTNTSTDPLVLKGNELLSLKITLTNNKS